MTNEEYINLYSKFKMRIFELIEYNKNKDNAEFAPYVKGALEAYHRIIKTLEYENQKDQYKGDTNA